MKRTVIILLSMIVTTSIYGTLLVQNPQYFHVLSFHIPMAIADAITIGLLLRTKVPVITELLVILLSISIINHSFGGFAWASYNVDIRAFYDINRLVISAAELLVLNIGGMYRVITGKRNNTAKFGLSGIHVVAISEVHNRCN